VDLFTLKNPTASAGLELCYVLDNLGLEWQQGQDSHLLYNTFGLAHWGPPSLLFTGHQQLLPCGCGDTDVWLTTSIYWQS
jgi:hypothetical protein